MTLNWDWILGKKNDHRDLPVKSADEDYDPVIEKLRQVTCYDCNGVFWIDENYNPNAIRYTKKPGCTMKNSICCPYCHSHLPPNVLARNERDKTT